MSFSSSPRPNVSRTRSRPLRTLAVFFLLIAILYGWLFAGVKWSDASWKPKLALDLAGGTQVVLTPRLNDGAGEEKITDDTIQQTIEIMRQRADAGGVAEAQVSSQGGRNIIVDLPGSPDETREVRDRLKEAAQMRFRPVLAATYVQPPEGVQPTGPGAAPEDGQTPSANQPSVGDPAPAPSVAPVPSTTENGRPAPALNEVRQATPAPTTPTGSTTPTAAAPTTGQSAPPAAPTDGQEPNPAATPTGAPTSAGDLRWITPELQKQLAELKCEKKDLEGTATDDPEKPLVACSSTGIEKFILGPVEIQGSDLKGSEAGLKPGPQGQPTNQWIVNLEFNEEGTQKFRDVTSRITSLPQPTNRFAVVLDGAVITAPRSNAVITNGQAMIEGGFTQETAQSLAQQLRFGALPISFEVQTEDQISALLGSEQLQRGLLAGAIGLLLVFLYSLLQYRVLGFITITSLIVAAVITYPVIALLGWGQGYRLSLAGIVGLIVSIGVTADSFIVYFERIKDELREGRRLVGAVDTGWKRALRTILASDAMNLVAAVVLYILAVGGVRGFAFTLGLMTVIDLIIVTMFTHPLMDWLSRKPFFAHGHPASGLHGDGLRSSNYRGRGQMRSRSSRRSAANDHDDDDMAASTALGLAERKAAERRAAREQAQEAPHLTEGHNSTEGGVQS